MNNREAYSCLRHAFEDMHLPESEAEAREVICHFAACSSGDLISKFDEEASFDCDAVIRERRSGRPLAYIIGEKHFYGISFYVDERVLIPRYDTEIIVSEALDIINKTGAKNILDLCCGSGCIGISLRKNADINVTMSDVSEGALEVAGVNSERLGVSDIKQVQSDLFSDIEDRFDMIVSNPPYVTDEEYKRLDIQVRDYEPSSTLLGGLRYYERIAGDAGGYLKRGGHLLLEIGYGQEDAVKQLLEDNGYTDIRSVNDLNGIPRVIVCTKS